jgi:DNA repair exonuclease SbcCD ATPase subunit
MSRLDEIVAWHKRMEVEKAFLEKQIRGKEDRIAVLKKEHEITEKARAVIQCVAQDTQKQLEFHLSHLVTMALHTIFDDPYDLSVEFVQRRGKTEVDILFSKNGEKIDPLSASGGGVVDVASLFLQISLLTLMMPKRRNILFLDEPLRFLKGEGYPEKGMEVIKEISEKLGMQIVMVSHIPEFIESADRTFLIEQKDGVSYCNEG